MSRAINTGKGALMGALVGSVVGALSDPFVEPEELLPNLKPGDLIEFERGTYRHWAMCSEKHGYVFNICAEDKSEEKAKITLDKLVEVADLDPSYRQVRVNNKEESARRKGLKARPVKDSLAEAKSLVNTFVPYNFRGDNCESYCTKWKYGRGFSDQVNNGQAAYYGTGAVSLLWGGIGAMIGGVTAGPPGALAGYAIGTGGIGALFIGIFEANNVTTLTD